MHARAFTVISISMLCSAPLFAQQDFSAVEIETVPLSDRLYVLFGAGGNIALSVGEDGALLVDAQYAPLSGKIQSAVAAVTQAPIRFVINTHWHGDHTGGNENFHGAGATIVAHDNVRRRMSIEVDLPLFDSLTPPSQMAARPAVTYADAMTMHWNGETLRVFHVESAHTDGDSIIHFADDNIIHMGDTLWTSGYPRVDPGAGGGSVQGVIEAVELVAAIADDSTQLIPGHGPLPAPGAAFLVEYATMLRTIQERVSALITDGLTEDDVVAASPTDDFDARWGAGYMSPERFTRVVYRSLMQ